MLKVPITAICQQCFRYCDYHKWMILVSNRTSPWAKSDIIFCLVWHAEHEYIDTTNWLSFRFRKVSTQKVTTNYVFIYFVIKINQLKKKKKQLKKREDKNDVLRSLLFECQRRWSSFIYSPTCSFYPFPLLVISWFYRWGEIFLPWWNLTPQTAPGANGVRSAISKADWFITLMWV